MKQITQTFFECESPTFMFFWKVLEYIKTWSIDVNFIVAIYNIVSIEPYILLILGVVFFLTLQ